MLIVGKHFWALVYKKRDKDNDIHKGELVTWEEGMYIGDTEAEAWEQWRIYGRRRRRDNIEAKRLVILPGVVAGKKD